MDDDKSKKLSIDPISKAFGIEPMNNRLKPSGKIIIPDPVNDYDHSRQNLLDLIEQGNQYLKQFGELAISAQEPKYFEVLNNMFNSLIAANEKLLIIKKHSQDIEAKENTTKESDKPMTNNKLFVGSTNDLQNLLEKMNSDNTNEDV
jgi:hypothetical protein